MTRLLCLGDSITDCGRLFDAPPLGSGYVQMLSRVLHEHEMDWEIYNLGTDGFTTARILDRASMFFLPLKPDIITLLAGINDIGLMMNTDRTPSQKEEMMQKTLSQYRELLQVLSKAECPVILMEPFIIPWPQEYRNWISLIHTLSLGIETLSQEFHFPYIRLHDTLNTAARERGMVALTTDGIHLTEAGHEILAELLFAQLISLPANNS